MIKLDDDDDDIFLFDGFIIIYRKTQINKHMAIPATIGPIIYIPIIKHDSSNRDTTSGSASMIYRKELRGTFKNRSTLNSVIQDLKRQSL